MIGIIVWNGIPFTAYSRHGRSGVFFLFRRYTLPIIKKGMHSPA